MTQEKYFTLCEQMGMEPAEDKCPPEFSDFPEPLQQAIMTFNRLGDRVFPDIGYLGKDYVSLPLHMKVLNVTEEELFLEALVRLDAHLIKRSSEQMKKARDSAKKK
jgi:hypothetical protein